MPVEYLGTSDASWTYQSDDPQLCTIFSVGRTGDGDNEEQLVLTIGREGMQFGDQDAVAGTIAIDGHTALVLSGQIVEMVTAMAKDALAKEQKGAGLIILPTKS